MELQHTDSKRWNVKIRKNELDTLISAARWILNGRHGRIPSAAQMKLKEILESYEDECDKLYTRNNPPA